MVDEKVVSTFLELVQIDSISGKERKIADFLKEKLQALGLEIYEDDTGKKINTTSGNIIGKLKGTKAGEALLLTAHMDTVEPGKNVEPVIEDGIIKSKGDTILGSDDKAGVAIILEVLRDLKEKEIPHVDLEVVFSVFEEGGLLGAKNLDVEKLEAKYGYALDFNGKPGSLVYMAPFQDILSVMIYGKAAHAGVAPEEGINAILVASKAISQMKLGRLDEETTANIGIISGGKATNIVPDSVLIKGEVRSLSALKKENQVNQMVKIIKDVVKANNTTANIVVDIAYPGFSLDENSKVVQLAVEAAKEIGLEANLTKTGGGSDANVLNYRGISLANLAVGMQKVHTTKEYILVQDLIDAFHHVAKIVELA